VAGWVDAAARDGQFSRTLPPRQTPDQRDVLDAPSWCGNAELD
jgi:hypothetical protein